MRPEFRILIPLVSPQHPDKATASGLPTLAPCQEIQNNQN
jgi:hypothetical protein